MSFLFGSKKSAVETQESNGSEKGQNTWGNYFLGNKEPVAVTQKSVETQESIDLKNAQNIWAEVSKYANQLGELEYRLRNGENGRGRLFKTFRLHSMLPTTEKVRNNVIVPVVEKLVKGLYNLKENYENKIPDDLYSLVTDAYFKLLNPLTNCLNTVVFQCRDEDLSRYMLQMYNFFQKYPTLEVKKQGGRSRRSKQSRGIKTLSKRRKVLRGTRRR